MPKAGKWQNLYLKLGLFKSKVGVSSSNVISIAESSYFFSPLFSLCSLSLSLSVPFPIKKTTYIFQTLYLIKLHILYMLPPKNLPTFFPSPLSLPLIMTSPATAWITVEDF